MPDRVLELARAAIEWRDIGAELATLVEDSAADDRRRAAVGGDRPRLLSFEAAGLRFELEIAIEETGRRLVGKLVPPHRAALTIFHAGNAISVESDELGRFAAHGIAAGPVRLRCVPREVPNRQPVETEWTVL